MGQQVVRELNMDDRLLYVRFLMPLLSDRDFAFEGHDFTPRKTRITILEGPELRTDQLGIGGRGWQNANLSGVDVTETVLARARDHFAGTGSSGQAQAMSSAVSPGLGALRERLIGRLSAGPVTLEDIRAIAHDLMPDGTADELRATSDEAALDLLSSGDARLTR